MKSQYYSSILLKLLILHYLSLLCVSQDFDFFYFVQQVSEFCSLDRAQLVEYLDLLIQYLFYKVFPPLLIQWPGSYCDTQKSCCYPTTGKPAPDFGIHGLWPNYKDGSYPSNCDPDSPFNPSEVIYISSQLAVYRSTNVVRRGYGWPQYIIIYPIELLVIWTDKLSFS